MTMSTRLQFHAPASEVGTLLRRWLAGLDCQGVALTFDDRRIVMERDRWDVTLSRANVYLALFRTEPFLDDRRWTNLEFMDQNPGFLSVMIMHPSDGHLNEMMIGAVASEPEGFKCWQRVVARARRSLLRGATLVGVTGVARDDRSHRYSAGALALAEEGVLMTTTGRDGPVWILDGVEGASSLVSELGAERRAAAQSHEG